MKAAKREGSRACGLSSCGQMGESNATRDVDRLLNRFGLSIRVPRDTFTFVLDDGSALEVPWVRPSSWVAYWLDKCPAILFGGVDKHLERELEGFWTCYEATHGGHEVYRDPSKLKQTLPLLLHGDEGRYLKRSNYMICTLESVLGSHGKMKQTCDCCKDEVLQRYPDVDVACSTAELKKATRVADRQRTTVKGHCYLTRFLCFGLPSRDYKQYPGLLQRAFELVAEDMQNLATNGIRLKDGRHFFAGFLGIKGDLKFHHQVGHLCRSYHNLSSKRNNPMCHLCLAGAEGIPFESLAAAPAWQETLFLQAPWNEDATPALASIDFDRMALGAIYRLDPFHLFKVGLGRDLVGSTIVVLARLSKFDFDPEQSRSIESRLNRAHNCFRLYCAASHRTPALRSFSKYLMNCQDMFAYPWANVKGSDTVILLHWLLFFLRAQMRRDPEDPESLFKAIRQTLESAITWLDLVYGHGLWLHRKCGQRTVHHLLRMLRGYKFCSSEVFKLSIPGYGLKPKLHALHHLAHDMQTQLNNGCPRILSPLAFNCESNEDMVGRVCRLSRRVSARTVNHRVFDRLFYKTKALLRRFMQNRRR